MIFLIIILSIIYLFVGAIISGILDDNRNSSITDGLLNKKIGVIAFVLLWPALIVFALLITLLNAAYLIGRKIRGKTRCINGLFKLD